MRRFWAFIVMAVTIFCTVIFSVQMVFENKTLGHDFSSGREVVYKISDRDSKDFDIHEASQEILRRLELSGISDPHVAEDGTDMVRVNFMPSTTAEKNSVLGLIEKSGEISVCTGLDYCLKGDELLREERATVYYPNGLNAFPGLNVNSKENYAKLTAKNADVTDENDKKYFYIWVGRVEGDTLAKAKTTDEEGKEMAKKMVGFIPLEGGWDEANLRLYVAANGLQESLVTNSQITKNYVNMLNADELNFTLNRIYEHSSAANLGDSGLTAAYITVGVSFIVVLLILTLAYGYPGIVAGVSILAGLLLDVLLFNFLNFEFSMAAVMGIALTIILGGLMAVIYFERLKDELSKGRLLEKANKEAYRRSFKTLLDVSAIALIGATITFLVGQRMIQIYAGTAIVSILVSLVIVNILMKWMMYWLASAKNIKADSKVLGLRGTVNSEKQLISVKEKKPVTYALTGTLFVASLIGAIVMGFVGSAFNYSDNYTPTDRIQIVGTEDVFKTENDVRDFLETKLELDIKSLYFVDNGKDEEHKKYYVDAVIKGELDDSIRIQIDSFIKEKDSNSEVISFKSTPIEIEKGNNNLYLIVGLVVLFSFVYVAARFSLQGGLATLVTTLTTGSLAISLPSLLRIPFNSVTNIGIIGGVILSSVFAVIYFAQYKNLKKDAKLKHPVASERLELSNKALNISLPVSCLFGVISLALPLVGLIAGGEMTIGYYLSMVLPLLASFLLSVFCLPSLYLSIRNVIRFQGPDIDMEKISNFRKNLKEKRKGKVKKVETAPSSEPTETIIPGIND